MFIFFFFKQKTAYEMRISDWSSDVCSSDLQLLGIKRSTDRHAAHRAGRAGRLVAALPRCRRRQLAHLLVVEDCHPPEPRSPNPRKKHSCDSPGIVNARKVARFQIGRASWRERVCKYV